MARKPRLHTPGDVYHVILRGNAQQDVFSDNKDRHRFCTFLSEASARFDHRILAFCLMTNHVHLLIQVEQLRLSRIIQSVSQRYTQWFNWRYHLTGPIFHTDQKMKRLQRQLSNSSFPSLAPISSGLGVMDLVT
jgi:putative transposase